MTHIPDDDNLDEFMNASAEEWSKPSQPSKKPASADEPTDRWGSPIQQENSGSDAERWGSEPSPPASQGPKPPGKQGGRKTWVIILIVVIVLCLCTCITVFGLSRFGIDLVQGLPF